VGYIPKLVTDAQNDMLNSKFLEDEVKTALFQLHPDKVLGLDGFPANFFQKCWDIIKKDIMEALEESRTS